MAYEIYVDPTNDPKQRQHVEGSPTYTDGQTIIGYLTARLPKDDRIFGEWGPKQPDTAPFDASRMRESENLPSVEGVAV